MPTKRKRRETFNTWQKAKLKHVANEVFDTKFKGKPSPQAKMALALGNLSQTSVSAMLAGKYTPSVQVAELLAQLAGVEDLRDLVGDYYVAGETPDPPLVDGTPMPNLRACVAYHGTERWPAWVVAAAKAGAFSDDVSPAEWEKRLDKLQKKLG